MTIYLDIIFLLNILFNSTLLYFTAYFRKKSFKQYRLWIGSIIGASSVFLIFSSFSYIVMNPLYKIFLSFLIIFVVFSFENLLLFIKDVLAFYLITFLTGGILMGLHYFFQFNSVALQSFLQLQTNSFGDSISWLFVVIVFPLAYFFGKKQLDSFEVTSIKYDELVDCMISIDNEVFQFKGLVDSGNSAQNSLNGYPVNFISYHAIQEKLPNYKKVANIVDASQLEEETINLVKNKRFTLVPFQVIGGKTNLVIAFMPDWFLIQQGNELKKIKNCYISLTTEEFDVDSSFSAILNPKSLQYKNIDNK